jgi:ferredoxin-NADP reductase
MMRFIDNILNKITMYRLVTYELLFLVLAAMGLSVFGVLSYSPLLILYSVLVIGALALAVNTIFAYAFDAPSNPESNYITILILALIISPPTAFVDIHFFILAGWATAWAIASKYIFAFQQKHFFNPAAFGVAVTALFLHQTASWWVGTLWMLPFVAVGGFLVARKIHRFDMVLAFGAVVALTIIALSLGVATGPWRTLQEAFLYAPVIFLGTVMLTEPMTTPPTRFLRICYAALVGFLFAPEIHFGSFYFTPELALLVGNIFVFIVSPKTKLLLTLKDRIQLAPDTFEFVFSSPRKLAFRAGQYLEWTLPHARADARGIRRYFTIASSPTDPDFRLGVKFYEKGSTFKKKLLTLAVGDGIIASQLAGDFVLPSNPKKKLVFIAGGIGITPFRSMLQYLLDTGEKRDIALIYTNKTIEDTAYVDILDRADRELGVRVLPIFSNQSPEDKASNRFASRIDQQFIRRQIPDYKERMFYLSGPRGMVTSFSDQLQQIGIPHGHIKKDFFPGFA